MALAEAGLSPQSVLHCLSASSCRLWALLLISACQPSRSESSALVPPGTRCCTLCVALGCAQFTVSWVVGDLSPSPTRQCISEGSDCVLFLLVASLQDPGPESRKY